MGRWSRIAWVMGVTASLGCATPSLQNGLLNSQTLSDKPVPEVASHNIVPTVSAAPVKDPDLAPEKAAKLCITTGEELEKNGHYDKAIYQYELALKHQPRMPGVQKKLAACYAGQKQFEKLVTLYQKELAQNPKDADILNDLGYTYYEMDDFKNAEKYLRQAIALKPGMQRAHGNLGLALGRQKRWKESLEAFKKAGSPAVAQANLAAMYLIAGEHEHARSSCNIALGLDPSLKSAKELLAKLDSMPDESEKTIQQAESRLTEPSATKPSVTNGELLPAQAIQLQKPVRRGNSANSSNAFKPVTQ